MKPLHASMILCFDNYFVKQEKNAEGGYVMTILKVTGPALFDREVIHKTAISSLESLHDHIQYFIPQSHLRAAI